MSANLSSAGNNTASTSVDRPNPLKEAAQKVGVAAGAAAAVIGALVSYGVLSVSQGDALSAAAASAQSTTTALGTVVGGVIPLIGAVVAAFTSTNAAKQHVTPVSSPRDDAGNVLAPVAPVTGTPRVPGDGIGDHRADG